MNTSELRQSIDADLARLSRDRLRLAADFIKFLAQQEQQEPNPAAEQESDFRPPRGSLLSHTETWEGDDFADCLQTVYETRSQIQA